MNESVDPKILMIGLEAFEPALVEQWTESGDLPNIKMLIEQGSYCRLDTTGLLTASVWGVFNIGKRPENTGLYYNFQWDPGRMRIQRQDWGTSKYPYFWTRLSQLGKRTIVIDPDLAGLQPQANSIQIIGWQGHESWRRPGSWPPELMRETIRRFGREHLGLEHAIQGQPRKQQAVWKSLLSSVRRRVHLLLHFLRDENWDLLVANFPEGHRAGHQLWGFPENRGTVSQETADEPGTALKEVYKAIDTAIGELLAFVPPNTYILGYSPYGMGPQRGSRHLLGALLERLDGSLQGESNPGPKRRARAVPSYHHALQQTISRNSPVAAAAARMLPQSIKVAIRHHLSVGGIDWRHARFFSLPTDGSGYIRFNLRGREARGIVHPGDELEKLKSEIEDELMGWVDLRTGAPIVAKVWRTAELFPGPHLADLPDLLAEWGEPLATDLSRAPRAGVIRGKDPEHRAGEHSSGGLLIAKGPGIPGGARPPRASLLDVPPTVFRILGLPPLESLEGKAIASITARV